MITGISKQQQQRSLIRRKKKGEEEGARGWPIECLCIFLSLIYVFVLQFFKIDYL